MNNELYKFNEQIKNFLNSENDYHKLEEFFNNKIIEYPLLLKQLKEHYDEYNKEELGELGSYERGLCILDFIIQLIDKDIFYPSYVFNSQLENLKFKEEKFIDLFFKKFKYDLNDLIGNNQNECIYEAELNYNDSNDIFILKIQNKQPYTLEIVHYELFDNEVFNYDLESKIIKIELPKNLDKEDIIISSRILPDFICSYKQRVFETEIRLKLKSKYRAFPKKKKNNYIRTIYCGNSYKSHTTFEVKIYERPNLQFEITTDYDYSMTRFEQENNIKRDFNNFILSDDTDYNKAILKGKMKLREYSSKYPNI